MIKMLSCVIARLKMRKNSPGKRFFCFCIMYTINIKPAQKSGFCAFFRKKSLVRFFAFGGNRFIKRTVVDKLFRFIGSRIELFFQSHGGGF